MSKKESGKERGKNKKRKSRRSVQAKSTSCIFAVSFYVTEPEAIIEACIEDVILYNRKRQQMM